MNDEAFNQLVMAALVLAAVLSGLTVVIRRLHRWRPEWFAKSHNAGRQREVLQAATISVEPDKPVAFGYKILWLAIHVDRGTPASVERGWSVDDTAGDQMPDEEDVLRVADQWGFSPMMLEDRDYPHGVGLVGIHRKKH